MSRNLLSKEEAINQLYATIKTKFDQDGVLQDVRCLLQTKIVALMKGKSESSTLVPNEYAGDSRLMLLHQLIMEYMHWHGFKYTAEMFSMESGCENAKPMRPCLEGVLGKFDEDNVPILLQLVAELMEKQQKK